MAWKKRNKKLIGFSKSGMNPSVITEKRDKISARPMTKTKSLTRYRKVNYGK